MYFKENAPEIYVSDYASYNNGSIVGKWFDLRDYYEIEEFIEDIVEMFKVLDITHPLGYGYKRESVMFQDWENIPKVFVESDRISPNFWKFMEIVGDKGWNEAQMNFALQSADSYDLSNEEADLESIFGNIHVDEVEKYQLAKHYLIHWLGLSEEDAEKLENCINEDYCIRVMKHSGATIECIGENYLTDQNVEL